MATLHDTYLKIIDHFPVSTVIGKKVSQKVIDDKDTVLGRKLPKNVIKNLLKYVENYSLKCLSLPIKQQNHPKYSPRDFANKIIGLTYIVYTYANSW